MWPLLLGVVRGRVWEKTESTSEARCSVELNMESGRVLFALLVELDCCGEALEPPPKTRLKKPGFCCGVVAGVCVGNSGLRVETVGEGAGGSWNEGTMGNSRSVLALTNSCACALMLGSTWLLPLRRVL